VRNTGSRSRVVLGWRSEVQSTEDGLTWGLLHPSVAYANTVSVTVQAPGATSGPGSTFSEIETDADCSNGALISGGGINQDIGTGMASNGNHVMGTEPSSNGSTELTGSTGVVATDVAHWLAFGGTGGATDARSPRLPTRCVSPAT